MSHARDRLAGAASVPLLIATSRIISPSPTPTCAAVGNWGGSDYKSGGRELQRLPVQDHIRGHRTVRDIVIPSLVIGESNGDTAIDAGGYPLVAQHRQPLFGVRRCFAYVRAERWFDARCLVPAIEGASIDTTTANGRLIFASFFAGLTEFKRELIVERTRAGLESTRACGRHDGRPFKMAPARLRLTQAALGRPKTEVAEPGVPRQTLYRHVTSKGEIRPDGETLLARWARAAS